MLRCTIISQYEKLLFVLWNMISILLILNGKIYILYKT